MGKHFALDELVKAIHEFRKFTDQPADIARRRLCGGGSGAQQAIDRVNALLQQEV